PRTPEGKSRSRRNSMKHGLAGTGACALEAIRQEVAVEYHALAEIERPQDLLEQRLLEQAAIGSIQFLRAQAQPEAETRDRAERAVADWDAARDAEVAGAIARLASDPAGALAILSETTEGGDALADE